uniref:Triple QxxK/R motif-containing protein n=1 Tax=Seriola dumerili TaxID=41447 RepID=A0A3B4U7C2_SERDU
MGKKDASATGLPVDQYRKQIGKQDYKKTKSVLKATRLKAEAKKNSSGFRVRLSWTYFLFHITDVCYLHVFFYVCLPVLAHLPVCLSANHLLSICLCVCLPVCLRA